MERRILWVVSMLMAAAALVAGCINVDVPKGPYVMMDSGPRPVSPADQHRVRGMDKSALEEEALRLTGENDSFRLQNDKLKRENKELKAERDRYKDLVETLQDQMKSTRKR